MPSKYNPVLDKKFSGAVLTHQVLRNKAIGKSPLTGFTQDLAIAYENELKQQNTIDVTERLMGDIILQQLRMKKAELDALTDAAKDPNISLSLKMELFKRAYKIYEELGLKGD